MPFWTSERCVGFEGGSPIDTRDTPRNRSGRLRSTLTSYRLKPKIERITREVLDAFVDLDEFDFVLDIAAKILLAVIEIRGQTIRRANPSVSFLRPRIATKRCSRNPSSLTSIATLTCTSRLESANIFAWERTSPGSSWRLSFENWHAVSNTPNLPDH